MQPNTSAATCFVKLYIWNFQRVFAYDFVVVGSCGWLLVVVDSHRWLWMVVDIDIL